MGDKKETGFGGWWTRLISEICARKQSNRPANEILGRVTRELSKRVCIWKSCNRFMLFSRIIPWPKSINVSWCFCRISVCLETFSNDGTYCHFWKNSEFEIVNESFFGRRKRRKFYLETNYFKNLKMNSSTIDKINVIKYC